MGYNGTQQFFLGDLYDISSGISKNKEQFGSGYPFLSFKTVFNYTIIPTDLKDLAQTTLSEQNKYSILYGDVFLTRTSETANELGMSSVALKDYPQATFNGFTKRLRPKKGVMEFIDPKFIAYYLRSKDFRNQIDSISVLTTRASLNQGMIEKLTITVPNIETQKKIAAILSALDEKIAINREINDNLQQQAAALFSSLYDRSNTEVRFTDLIQILGGGTPKTGENTYWNGNIAFFTPKDVGTPYTLITEKTISKEGLSHCNSRLYPVNTVFVTARGTVGKVGMSGVPMAMNQSCYALVGKETHQLLVYFYTLKAVDRLKHKASGAVFDAITTRDFESEQIMKLSDDDATAFLRVAEPMFQEVLNNNIENLRLSTLQDSLLSKLMSGEIDVSAVQF